MTDLERVRKLLIPMLPLKVAREIGVTSRTIMNVRDGKSCSTKLLYKLVDYFKKRGEIGNE